MSYDYVNSFIDSASNDATKGRQMPSNGILYDANDGGNSLSLPAEIYTPQLSDFLVNVNGNGTDWTVNIAKGTVLYRSSPNNFKGGCLREFLIQKAAVWPVDSFTDGDYTDSPWVDNGGFFTISPESEGGSNDYGVYIIANQYQISGGSLLAGTPYLALMPIGGDAELKTQPWGEESECDLQRWFNLFSYLPVMIMIHESPYEVFGNLEKDQVEKLQNYNCQRIRLAHIHWNTTDLIWEVTQEAAGTITIPYNIFFSGAFRLDVTQTDPPPSWITTPYYEGKQNDWEGNFTDCEKWDGTGISPTTQLDV